MSSVLSPRFAELVAQIHSGRITARHIDALLEDPDRLLSGSAWHEELICPIPKGVNVDFPSLTSDGKLLYRACLDGKQFVVHGTDEGKQYDAVWNVSFTSDGKSLYGARLDGKQFVVHGTDEGKQYDAVWNVSLTSDGKLLYGARLDGKQFVVHGTEEGKQYDAVFSLRIRGDVIEYGARKGRRILRVSKSLG